MMATLTGTQTACPAHLMVVDDNKVMRTVLVQQLTRAGHRVESAGDGHEALKLVIEKPFDLILLDFVMEPMDGMEVLERIRRVRSPLQMPILMMSATTDPREIVRATNLGANDFIQRPFKLPVLQAKIRHYLQMREASLGTQVGPLASLDGSVEAGTEIGPYRIDSNLGEGAMGRVFRATDTRLLRPVALKVLAQHRVKAENRDQFLHEARALARVQHPNVAVIYDVGMGAFPYLAMELVVGAPLSDSLGKNPIPLRTACQWSIAILHALGAIHAQGVVHRDLKPDNILLSKSDEIKLVDFGVAHFLESSPSDSSSGLFGTPEWMSPEQINTSGPPIDGRSDLFSLASILYLMLTGKHPFPAQTMKQQLFLISTQDPIPPTKIVPTIPKELESICLKGLSKEPETRYQSADEFAAELQKQMNLQATEP